jgi:hypothetical protein
MNTSDTHNQRFAQMTFASVYPLYLANVSCKSGEERQNKRRIALGHRMANRLRHQKATRTHTRKGNV